MFVFMYKFTYFKFVGVDNFDIYSVVANPDKFVKIVNKGWYLATVKLTYDFQNQRITQTGLISPGFDYGFKIPFSINYDSEFGCLLESTAVAGLNIMKVRIKSNPECFDIWGTTLNPFWSRFNC